MNDITELRAQLFDTIRKLKAGELDTDQARAINQTAAVIVDSARVEIEHIKVVGEGQSQFVAPPLPEGEDKPLPPGILGVRQHRIK